MVYLMRERRVASLETRPVIPAKAGIQLLLQAANWIPAFAGMTAKDELDAGRGVHAAAAGHRAFRGPL